MVELVTSIGYSEALTPMTPNLFSESSSWSFFGPRIFAMPRSPVSTFDFPGFRLKFPDNLGKIVAYNKYAVYTRLDKLSLACTSLNW